MDEHPHAPATTEAPESSRERRSPRSLRSHLIVWFAVLGLVPAVVAALVTAAVFWHAQTERETARLLDATRDAEEAVTARIHLTSRAAVGMAANGALRAAFARGQLDECRRIVTELAPAHGVDAVAIADAAGNLSNSPGGPPALLLSGNRGHRRLSDGTELRWLPAEEGGLWLACSAKLTGARAGRTAPGEVICLVLLGNEFCQKLHARRGVDIALWHEELSSTPASAGVTLTGEHLDALSAADRVTTSLASEERSYRAVARLVDLDAEPLGIRVAAVGGPEWDRGALARAVSLNVAMLASVVLLAIGAGAALARRLADPVDALTDAAKELARGNLARRAEVHGPEEFRPLVTSFNRMAAELQAQTRQLQASNKELDLQMGRVQKLNDLLQEAVHTDALTQVGTHGHVQEQLAACLAEAGREGVTLSALMVDVDDLKWVNDTYGHPAGDRALKAVANALTESVRDSDVVGRHGGDEFCVVLPTANAEEAARCVERIRSAIGSVELRVDGQMPIRLSVSVGAATFPDDGADAGSLVAAADRTLYQDKRQRRIGAPGGPAVGRAGGLSDEEAACVQTAVAIAASVDGCHSHSVHHSHTVAVRALEIAQALGMSEAGQRVLRVACLVHDIGKVSLPQDLFGRDATPTDAERLLIDSHPEVGARLLQHLGVADPVPDIVRHHHERFDGSGRPDRLKGEQIPPASRIIAVAKEFVRLTSPEADADAMSPEEALLEIELRTGRAFDPKVVARLRQALSPLLQEDSRSDPASRAPEAIPSEV